MINNSVPKYTVRVGGSDRTIDSEKFNTHLDAIIEQTPDARIRVVNKETGESRAMPVGNYRQAVASGIYSPYETNTFKNTPRASVAPAAIARASANENDVNAGAQATLEPVPQPTIPKSSITSWLPPAQDNYVELRPEQLPDAEMRAADAVAATRRAKEHRQKGLENWLADQRPHSVAEVYADLQRERQTIGGQIKEMTATLAGKKKEAGAQWMAKEEEARKENPFATALLYAGRAPRTAEIADYDTSNYNIAQSFADDARKIYEQWERNQRSDANYIKNAGYGFKDGVFDVDTWTFGITDLLKNISLGQVVEKADRGEALSDSEQSLLDAVALQLATAAFYGSELGRGYKAGGVGAVALPFMAEMALNPLACAGKGLANSVAKYGLKRFGEKALQSVGGRIVKGGARVIGDIGASYGGALTVGMGSTLADASNRMTGDIQFDFSDGRPVYAGRGNAEDFWPAFAKAATARAGEYYSERLGDYIGPLFGKLGNVLGKTKPGAGFARWPGVRQAKELIGGISNTEFRKLLQAGGLHNIPTELLEEEFNMLLNWGTVGDVSWSDITDLDQQIDLGLGVATLGGALSAMNMSGYRFNGQYSAQRSMERADRRAERLLGGHWAELKEAIDNIDDRQLARQLGDLYRSDGLNDSQKAAITDYARKSNYREGVRMAGEKNAAEDLIAPEQQELINAYNDGAAASLRDIATKQVIYGDYMQARGMFGNEQLQELDALSIPEEVYIAEHPEQVGLLTAYFNAKARKDGLIDATRAEVEDRVQRTTDAVRAKIHTDGNIYPVVMKDGTSAYIISGDIYLNEDGTIDTKRSTGRVVIWRGDGDSGMTDIRSENGKADMVDVHELGAVHNVSPGAAIEEAVRNTARTEAYEKAAAEIEGRQMELEQGQPAAQVTGSVAANDIAPAGEVAAPVERQGEIPPGEQPSATAPVYPTDKGGDIDYDAIESPEMLAAALQQEFGNDAQALAIQSLNEAREILAKATANTKGNPMQRLRAVKAAEREVAKFEQVAGSLTPAAGQSVGESSGGENLQEPGRSPIFVNENNSENGQGTEGESDERGDREDNGQAVASKRPRRGTGVSERLSQGADGGGIETGGRVGQEAPHDRGSESATGYVGQAARRKGSKKEQLKAIEATAKEAGMWIDDPSSLGNYFSEGGENEVYHNPLEEKVYKINNFEYAGDDVSEFFDRIDAHNDLFGNVPYKIIGFSKNSKGEISAVLEQPYVESEREATEDEIAAYMEALGFEPDGVDVFDNGRYTVFDAVPNNVLMGKDGRLYFIDPQISVNQPEAGSINEVSETGQAHSKTISDSDAYPEQLRLRFRDRNPIFDMDDSEIPVGNRASTLVKLKELFPRSIDKGGVGKLYLQKLRECAEKIFKGEALYNRFSYGEQDGLARGGVFHVEASLILGASAREGETQDEINERQEAEIENYARARGIWIEDSFNVFNQKYGEKLDKGGESIVWQDKIGHVIKSTDPYLFRTLQEKFDSITLHNSYFPEVPIEVIGFGKSSEDIFQLILKQPFIIQRPQFNATAAQIAAEVKSRGFDIHEEALSNYKNDKTLLRDLHADNVIVTRSGKIMIIDPIMNLNVPSLGYGGTRTLDESVDIAPDGVRFRDNKSIKPKNFENGRRRFDARSVKEAVNKTTGLFAETAGKRRMDILRPRSTWNENGKNGEDSENGIPPDRNIQQLQTLSSNRQGEIYRPRVEGFVGTNLPQHTGDASQAYPRRGGGHRKDVGGVAEREGYGILRSPENAVGRYRPPSLDYKTTLSLFEGLQQEYEELLENRENNPDFESDLNRWRDRKVEVVRDYLYSLQEQYGTNDIIIVLNGATDVETKWEVGRIVNPNITEDDLNKIVEQWEAIVGEAVGLKIKGYDVVIFDVMTSDNINRLEDFKKIFIHESTHSIIDHILTNEQLVEVLNETKDVPDFKKILDHPAYRDQEDYNKGAEIITHSIGDLTFARKNYAFDLYVNGIFTIEETLERINYDIPYTKQRIAEVLEAFKYGREEKTTRAYFGRGTGAEGGVFPEVEEKISRDSIRRGRQYPGVERAGVASGATGTDAETGRGEGTKRQQLNLTIPNLDAEITTAVRRATAHIGVPVRIVEDVEEIVSEDAALQVRQRAARGWYDTATGETVVVVPNHDSAADAVATVLHEAVGHHGMRALYGDAFDSFLEQVYAEVGEDVRRDIFRLSQTLGKDFGNIKLATEEYIASLAEQGIRNPFAGATIVWKKIKDALNALLRRFGIAVSMSENDLRYLLWKSYNRIKAGDGLMDIARKAAADAELSPYRSGRVLRFRENRWPVKRLAVS